MEELAAAITRGSGLKCTYYPHIGIMEVFNKKGHRIYVDLSPIKPDCSFRDFHLKYFEDNLPTIIYGGEKIIYNYDVATSNINSAVYYIDDICFNAGLLYEDKILYYGNAVLYKQHEFTNKTICYDEDYNEIQYIDSPYMRPPCDVAMYLISDALPLTRLTLIGGIGAIPGRFIYNGNDTLRREKDDEIFIATSTNCSVKSPSYLLSKSEIIKFDTRDFEMVFMQTTELDNEEYQCGDHVYFRKDHKIINYDIYTIDGHVCVYTDENGYEELLSRSINPAVRTKAAIRE